MHTTEWEDHSTEQSVTFLHNGDYSGEVEIVQPSQQADYELRHMTNQVSVKVPYQALQSLVIQQMKEELIVAFEEMDTEELAAMMMLRAMAQG